MYTKGMYTDDVLKLAGISIIPVLLAIWIGGKIAKKINQKAFLKVVYVLLIISGATLLLNAFTSA